jgi:osmotically-inducible protein OsmY
MLSPGSRSLQMALLASLVLSGCVPAIIGGGVLAEKAVAEERGLGVTLGDTGIRSSIHAKVMRYNMGVFHRLNFKVREGKVLVAGNVDTDEQMLEVIRLIWTVNGVREVINEIRVGQKGTMGGYARDSWITTKVKTTLLFNRDIASRNYSIETVGAVVYIMGVAQNQDELDHVTDLISRTDYVQKVMSYVRIKGSGQETMEAAAPSPTMDGAPVTQARGGDTVRIESLPPAFEEHQDEPRSGPSSVSPVPSSSSRHATPVSAVPPAADF